uniref:PWI domain-containing protein n=1 Tax=Globisporangium ultimum (strain ATCC 200006 / CBS 805.95 / DAOM BR144) TaxID=431595 RepID=K3WYI3_GLOUD
MGEAYAAYASALAQRMAQFLRATRLRVKPSADFVSCACAGREHFVPASALDAHLKALGGDDAPAEEDDDGVQSVLQSLLEPPASPDDAPDTEGEIQVVSRQQLVKEMAELAPTAAEFYTIVQKWQRIPRAFAHLAASIDNSNCSSPNNVAMAVPKQSVQGWLIAELSRTVFQDEPLDMELVDYVVGLLEHPEFCQPDLLILELHEFLGQDTKRFVLALWKFLVIEIALRIAFNTTKDTLEKQLRVKREQDAADQAERMLETLRATEKMRT